MVGELAEPAETSVPNETKISCNTLARLSLRAIWESLHDFARESRASVIRVVDLTLKPLKADIAEACEDFIAWQKW